jgi:serine/threonine-protein kinase SRPK3
MKSMVCDYPSVQREINAHEVLSKTAKISDASGKQHIRQALDHFELSQGDRNYHFLIHEPLGATLKLFLDMSKGSLPISYVQELTYQILHALNFIHSTQVIHAGPTLLLLHSVL